MNPAAPLPLLTLHSETKQQQQTNKQQNKQQDKQQDKQQNKRKNSHAFTISWFPLVQLVADGHCVLQLDAMERHSVCHTQRAVYVVDIHVCTDSRLHFFHHWVHLLQGTVSCVCVCVCLVCVCVFFSPKGRKKLFGERETSRHKSKVEAEREPTPTLTHLHAMAVCCNAFVIL